MSLFRVMPRNYMDRRCNNALPRIIAAQRTRLIDRTTGELDFDFMPEMRWMVDVLVPCGSGRELWTGYGRNLGQAKLMARSRKTSCYSTWPLRRSRLNRDSESSRADVC